MTIVPHVTIETAFLVHILLEMDWVPAGVHRPLALLLPQSGVIGRKMTCITQRGLGTSRFLRFLTTPPINAHGS